MGYLGSSSRYADRRVKLHVGVCVRGWLAVFVLYLDIFMANPLSSTQAFYGFFVHFSDFFALARCLNLKCLVLGLSCCAQPSEHLSSAAYKVRTSGIVLKLAKDKTWT